MASVMLGVDKIEGLTPGRRPRPNYSFALLAVDIMMPAF